MRARIEAGSELRKVLGTLLPTRTQNATAAGRTRRPLAQLTPAPNRLTRERMQRGWEDRSLLGGWADDSQNTVSDVWPKHVSTATHKSARTRSGFGRGAY